MSSVAPAQTALILLLPFALNANHKAVEVRFHVQQRDTKRVLWVHYTL